MADAAARKLSKASPAECKAVLDTGVWESVCSHVQNLQYTNQLSFTGLRAALNQLVTLPTRIAHSSAERRQERAAFASSPILSLYSLISSNHPTSRNWPSGPCLRRWHKLVGRWRRSPTSNVPFTAQGQPTRTAKVLKTIYNQLFERASSSLCAWFLRRWLRAFELPLLPHSRRSSRIFIRQFIDQGGLACFHSLNLLSDASSKVLWRPSYPFALPRLKDKNLMSKLGRTTLTGYPLRQLLYRIRALMLATLTSSVRQRSAILQETSAAAPLLPTPPSGADHPLVRCCSWPPQRPQLRGGGSGKRRSSIHSR